MHVWGYSFLLVALTWWSQGCECGNPLWQDCVKDNILYQMLWRKLQGKVKLKIFDIFVLFYSHPGYVLYIALWKPCNGNTYHQCTSLFVIVCWRFLNESESHREGLIYALLKWRSIFPRKHHTETWILLRTNLSLFKLIYLSATCKCEPHFYRYFLMN